jgi:hypothetical protein
MLGPSIPLEHEQTGGARQRWRSHLTEKQAEHHNDHECAAHEHALVRSQDERGCQSR